jgi:aminoglycoside phosphotransferase (APT) family kinase protein
MTASATEVTLPADLGYLVRGIGVPLARTELVTTLRARDVDSGCFRLTFADGRVLKGRHVEALEQADRLHALTGRLDPCHFPAVLARRGRAFLTAWIDGTPLRPGCWTPAVLEACGGLHAAVHRVPVDDDTQWQRRHGPWQARMAKALGVLVDGARLDITEARRAETLACEFEPRVVERGLCHGDLCAENIVIDGDGRVVIVDNDSLAVDAWGYDLARTWYRWPMTATERRQYMAGYGPASHLVHVAAYFIHWAIVVLVEAAAFRVRVGVDADSALRRLRAVVRDPVQSARFPGLVPEDACTL